MKSTVSFGTDCPGPWPALQPSPGPERGLGAADLTSWAFLHSWENKADFRVFFSEPFAIIPYESQLFREEIMQLI